MNDIITTQNDQLVTTTLAIAEGTGNDHASVIKLVRTYLPDLEEFGMVRFEIRPRSEGQHGGGDTEFAEINEQQSTLILTYMRNSEVVRAFKKRLVKEFWDMRTKLASKPAIDPMTILSDPAAMRGLLLNYTEKVIALEVKVTEQASLLEVVQPKAEAFDLVSAGKDTMTFTEASKVLGKKRVELTAYLHEKGWIYRQNGSWVAYDQHIRTGCLQYKEATYTDDKTGLECHKPYCHITPKGMTKLALMLQTQDIEVRKAA